MPRFSDYRRCHHIGCEYWTGYGSETAVKKQITQHLRDKHGEDEDA